MFPPQVRLSFRQILFGFSEGGCDMKQPPKTPLDSAPAEKRALGEIYDSVVDNIYQMYDNQITHKEAHEAARNLLGFCQKVIEIRSREIK